MANNGGVFTATRLLTSPLRANRLTIVGVSALIGVALLVSGLALWLAALAAVAICATWMAVGHEWMVFRSAPANEAEALLRQRRLRSIAIAVALAAWAALFYAVTIVRLGGNVSRRKAELLPAAIDAVRDLAHLAAEWLA
ncbi:MAG: hypothetical protein F9K44_04040 [Hyphomicrobiaceae bacterium]|nr:MAG: hypothetical protein F9K44_04040 [Hyphomicrobiaceae bacterium]